MSSTNPLAQSRPAGAANSSAGPAGLESITDGDQGGPAGERSIRQLILGVVFIPLLIIVVISFVFSVFYSMQIKRQADCMYDALSLKMSFERFNFNMQNILLDISPSNIDQAAAYFAGLDSWVADLEGEQYFGQLQSMLEAVQPYLATAREVLQMHTVLLEIMEDNDRLEQILERIDPARQSATHIYVANFKAREALPNIISELGDLRAQEGRVAPLCRLEEERSAELCTLFRSQQQRINLLESDAVLTSDRFNIAHDQLLNLLLEFSRAFREIKDVSLAGSEQVLSSIGFIPCLIAVLNILFLAVAFVYFIIFHRVFVRPIHAISVFIAARLSDSYGHHTPLSDLQYTIVTEINEIIRLVKFTLSENMLNKQQNLQLRKDYHKIFKMSSQDALTGALNRRSMDDFIKHSHQLPSHFAVMMVDIDFFKKLNDNFGHQTGDVVLRQVSKALSSSLKGTDRLYRYGGEEFCITLFDVTHENVSSIASRLNTAISSLQIAELGEHGRVTVSIGVSPVTEEIDTTHSVSDFIAKADEALYAAKHRGRNCFVLSEEIQSKDKLTDY